MEIYILIEPNNEITAYKTLTAVAGRVGKSRLTIRKGIEDHGLYCTKLGQIVRKVELS